MLADQKDRLLAVAEGELFRNGIDRDRLPGIGPPVIPMSAIFGVDFPVLKLSLIEVGLAYIVEQCHNGNGFRLRLRERDTAAAGHAKLIDTVLPHTVEHIERVADQAA